MAQRLRSDGQAVYLALADVDSPNDATLADDTRDLVAIARTHARNVGVNLPIKRDDLTGLTTDQQLQFVLDLYKVSRVVPEDASIETMQAHWDVFLATLRVTRSYCYEPFDGPIALFLAEELDYRRLVDFEVKPDYVLDKETLSGFENRAKAWDDYSTIPTKVYKVPGFHSLMALEPYVEVWAERILEWMEEAESR
jgi:thioesterase domain-containing protein